MRFIPIFVALACLYATDAVAQMVALTPSVIELKGSMGQSTTQTLTIRNGTSMPLSFDLEAQDVIVSGGKRAFVRAGDVASSIAATAVFHPASVTVPPGAARSTQVTLTIPRATEIRAIVALFRGTTKIVQRKGTATVSLGTLMTFNLAKFHSLSASELSVAGQSASQNVAFELGMVNDGSEPEMPRGMAIILAADGAMVGKVPFDPLRLLPGERLSFRTVYPGELKAGVYRVVSTFEFTGQSITRSATLVVQ